MSYQNLISIENLCYSIMGKSILKNVSFEMSQGTFFGVLGLNGAGKSTLIGLLAGTRNWQSGNVIFEGKTFFGVDPRIRRRVASVFQTLSLDQKLTASENLLLTARLYGASGTQAKSDLEKFVELFRLESVLFKPVGKMSGGEKRKVDLVRALMVNPSLLLLDEPTAGLDVPACQDFWECLERFRLIANLSVILSTHKPEEAHRCDKLVILSKGEVKAQGAPAELMLAFEKDLMVLTDVTDVEFVGNALEKNSSVSHITKFDSTIYCQSKSGHQALSQLMETVPSEMIGSLNIRKPTLNDYMLQKL